MHADTGQKPSPSLHVPGRPRCRALCRTGPRKHGQPMGRERQGRTGPNTFCFENTERRAVRGMRQWVGNCVRWLPRLRDRAVPGRGPNAVSRQLRSLGLKMQYLRNLSGRPAERGWLLQVRGRGLLQDRHALRGRGHVVVQRHKRGLRGRGLVPGGRHAIHVLRRGEGQHGACGPDHGGWGMHGPVRGLLF